MSSAHAHPRSVIADLPKWHVSIRNKPPETLSSQHSLHQSLPRSCLPSSDHFSFFEDRTVGILGRSTRTESYGTVIFHPGLNHWKRQFDGCGDTIVTLDDSRRRAESEFYQTTEVDGVGRRRSNMRTVSKEDYLLGRGANPRTGIVTPGHHSSEHSFDDTGASKIQRTLGPAKWRQKGDQWICLDAGQQNPLPTPQMQMQARPVNRRLRIPYQLPRGRVTDPHQVCPSASEPLQVGIRSITEPDSFPQHPGPMSGAFSTDVLEQQSLAPVINTSVRRKPVGGSPPKVNVGQAHHNDHRFSPNSNVIVEGQYSLPQARSSAAPTTRKEDPANIYSNTSPLSRQVSYSRDMNGPSRSVIPSISFLDPGPGPLTAHKIFPTKSVSKGPLCTNKELPCLPMSSGQSPQLHSTLQPQRKLTAAVLHDTRRDLTPPAQRPLGPRGGNPGYPYHRFQRIHSEPTNNFRNEDLLPKSMTGENITAIPTYDNPPYESLTRLTRRKVEGPRMMPPPCQRSMKIPGGRQTLPDPFTTTSTTTDIFTGERQSQNPRYAHLEHQQAMNMNRYGQIPRSITGFRTPIATAALHTDIENVSLPIPQTRPRDLIRPTMPTRAAGLHSVPKLQQLPKIQDRIHMEGRQPSSSIGMQTNRPEKTKSAEEKELQTSQIRPDTERSRQMQDPTHPNRESGYITELPIPEKMTTTQHGLIRRCSRCHDGFVINQPPNTDGFVDIRNQKGLKINLDTLSRATPGFLTPISELCEKHLSQIRLGIDNGSIQGRTTEHQEVGQHGKNYLGNELTKGNHERLQSLSSNSTHSMAKSEQDGMSHPASPASTTPTSESDATSPCKKVTAKRSKLSFVTRNFRKTLREELTPSIERHPTYPLTPDSFWGGDGTGGEVDAASAARKAIGLHPQSAMFESCSSRAVKKAMGTHTPRFKDDGPSPYDSLEVPRLRLNKKLSVMIDSSCASSLNESDTGRRDSTKTDNIDESYVHESVKNMNKDKTDKAMPSTTLVTPTITKSRNVSGASIETIRMPQVSNMGIGVLWELFLIPFEVTRMWFRNNPQLLSYAWQAVEGAWEMTCLINATTQRGLGMIYVYGKTGKLRLGKGMAVAEFLGDILRSSLYLILLAMVAVMLGRVLRGLILPLKLVVVIGRAILGLLGRFVRAIIT